MLCYDKLHFSVEELFEEEMQVKGEVEDVEQVVQQVEERQSPPRSPKKATDLMLCGGKKRKEKKRCIDNLNQGAVEKRQVMCPEGKRGKKCRKRMLQGE